MSVEQRAFIAGKITTALRVVWANFLLCAGLVLVTGVATLAVYSDQGTIRKDATDKWGDYGDRTVTFYTRDGRLSDSKGKARLGDAAEAYAYHVLAFACATCVSLLLPAGASAAFACKSLTAYSAGRRR